MANAITTRISLEGGKEVIEAFKKLGETGKKAFEDIQHASNNLKAPDLSPWQQLQKTLVSVGSSFVSVGQSITSAGRTFSLIGAAIGGTITAFGFLAHSASEAADAMDKSAQKAGLTIDAFGKLQFAAEQNDVAADEFTAAMGRLSKNIEEAKKGAGPASEAFSKVGVSISDLNNNSTDEVVLKLVDGFSKMADGAEKSALAIALFGRGGIQLIPFLNQTRDGVLKLEQQFTELGLGFTKEQAEIGDAFNDSLNLLSRAIGGIKNQIGLIFVPALTEASNAIIKFIKDNKDAIIGFVKDVVDAFNNLPAGVKVAIGAIVGFSIVFGPVLLAIGLFVQAIGFAVTGLASLAGGIGFVASALGGGLLAGIEIVIGGIAAFVAAVGIVPIAIVAVAVAIGIAVGEIIKHWDEIRAGFVAAFAAILQSLGTIIGNASAAANAIVQAFASIPGAVAKYFSNLVQLARAGFQQIVAAFKSVVGDIIGLFGNLIGRASAAADAIKDAFVGAFQSLWDKAKSVLGDILSWLANIIAQASVAASAIANAATGGGHAHGGPVYGSGSSTSDSIPARLSTGEYVIKAAAVKKYGMNIFHALNNMRLASREIGMHLGGAITAGMSPAPMRFSGGGLVGNLRNDKNIPTSTVNLQIGNRQFPLLGPSDVVDSLVAVIKQHNLASAGRVPRAA